MRATVAAAGIVLAVLGVAFPARAQSLVGYVAEIDGSHSGARLQRGAVPPRPLRLGENILAGDVIFVLSSVKVRIDTTSGPLNPCPPPTTGECRYVAPLMKGLQPSAVSDRLFEMLSWFSAPDQNLSTRSADRPRFRIGGGTTQSVASGERAIWLAWVDGKGPFEASVEVRGRLLARAETDERTVQLPAVQLDAGPARLIVKDAEQRQAVLPLLVEAAMPRPPSFEGQSVDADHALLLQAATLAATDHGRWTLEAIQWIGPAVPRVPAAAAMRRALAAGDRF